MDSAFREKVVMRTSLLSVLVNLLLASTKVIVGLLASSIAIVSEGINNASDVLTALLAMAGTKLAKKRPDRDHPFGHGRIEYITSFIIAALILVAGGELLLSSVKLIFEPEDLHISLLSLCIVALSLVAKLCMGIYTVKLGKKVESTSLTAVGLDALNDSYGSIVTILAALVFLLCSISLDAYAGIFTSMLVLKTGVDVIKDSISDLVGKRGKSELAQQIYREIRETEGVLGAANMMFHNYGPSAYAGSVNLEFDKNKTMGEVHELVHTLQCRIKQKYHVSMVFGTYAIDGDTTLRATIGDFVRHQAYVKSFHAVYLDAKTKTIYCDFIVDYCLKDWDALQIAFEKYMATRYPDYAIELTIEIDFV